MCITAPPPTCQLTDTMQSRERRLTLSMLMAYLIDNGSILDGGDMQLEDDGTYTYKTSIGTELFRVEIAINLKDITP
jgi:hypothetical protein